jgi:hypothetical protein
MDGRPLAQPGTEPGVQTDSSVHSGRLGRAGWQWDVPRQNGRVTHVHIDYAHPGERGFTRRVLDAFLGGRVGPRALRPTSEGPRGAVGVATLPGVSEYQPGGVVLFLGSAAALSGVAVIVVNVATSGIPLGAFVIGGLLLLSGLLLRIEAAIIRSRSGPGSADPDDGPPERPWHRPDAEH